MAATLTLYRHGALYGINHASESVDPCGKLFNCIILTFFVAASFAAFPVWFITNLGTTSYGRFCSGWLAQLAQLLFFVTCDLHNMYMHRRLHHCLLTRASSRNEYLYTGGLGSCKWCARTHPVLKLHYASCLNQLASPHASICFNPKTQYRNFWGVLCSLCFMHITSWNSSVLLQSPKCDCKNPFRSATFT